MTDAAEPELRMELLRRRDIEQEARFGFIHAEERGEEPDWEPVRIIDEYNLAFLVEVIGRHGWLGSDLVDVDGAHACWLMVQHAPLEYQDKWLPLMERAVRDGLAKLGNLELVYLQDRVNMRHKRRQTHGSQHWGRSGTVSRLWPVTDPANLNARRVAVDLPPLDQDLIDNAWTAEELREQGHPLDDPVCPDVYLLALHEPYEEPRHPVPINATIVHALTLLHPRVPQPDGGMIYRCLTEFPIRKPGCVVPVSTLTFELDGGLLWPQIGDWEAVTDAVADIARHGLCDAMPLGLPQVAAILLANGPNTTTALHMPGGNTKEVGAAEREAELETLTAHVRAVAEEAAFWPGDNLVAPPREPARLPYHPRRLPYP